MANLCVSNVTRFVSKLVVTRYALVIDGTSFMSSTNRLVFDIKVVISDTKVVTL